MMIGVASLVLLVAVISGVMAQLSAKEALLPTVPEGLKYSGLTPNSATLEWQQPKTTTLLHKINNNNSSKDNSKNLRRYTPVHAFIVAVESDRVLRVLVLARSVLVPPAPSSPADKDHYRYVLSGLAPGTQYRVRAAASGARGIGNYSAAVAFRLPQSPKAAQMSVAITTIIVLGVAIFAVLAAIVIFLVSSRCTGQMTSIYGIIRIGRSVTDSNQDATKNELYQFGGHPHNRGQCLEAGARLSPREEVTVNSYTAANQSFGQCYADNDDDDDSDDEYVHSGHNITTLSPPLLHHVQSPSYHLQDSPHNLSKDVNIYQNKLHKLKVVSKTNSSSKCPEGSDHDALEQLQPGSAGLSKDWRFREHNALVLTCTCSSSAV